MKGFPPEDDSGKTEMRSIPGDVLRTIEIRNCRRRSHSSKRKSVYLLKDSHSWDSHPLRSLKSWTLTFQYVQWESNAFFEMTLVEKLFKQLSLHMLETIQLDGMIHEICVPILLCQLIDLLSERSIEDVSTESTQQNRNKGFEFLDSIRSNDGCSYFISIESTQQINSKIRTSELRVGLRGDLWNRERKLSLFLEDLEFGEQDRTKEDGKIKRLLHSTKHTGSCRKNGYVLSKTLPGMTPVPPSPAYMRNLRKSVEPLSLWRLRSNRSPRWR